MLKDGGKKDKKSEKKEQPKKEKKPEKEPEPEDELEEKPKESKDPFDSMPKGYVIHIMKLFKWIYSF